MSPGAGRDLPFFVPGLAVVCGFAIAAVDSFASGVEVSPIVIVALLPVASSVVSTLATRNRWFDALLVWIWLHLALR